MCGTTRAGEGEPAAAAPRPRAPAGEGPWTCGWFDSSFELRSGLAVIEHRELPLELAVQALLGLDEPRARA